MTVVEAISQTPLTAFELSPTGISAMAAAITVDQITNPAGLARKRRREKMRGIHVNSELKSTLTSSADISLVCAKDKDGKGILPPKKRKYSIDHPDSISSITSTGSSVGGENLTPAVVKSEPNSTVTKKQKSTKPRAPRKQMRYDPDVPMTKEEASAWRREARRVRNRESAAASRRKIRNRIEDLEEEVEKWRLKYENLMKELNDKRNGTTSTDIKSSSQTQEGSLQSTPHTIIVPELSSSSAVLVSGSEGETDGGSSSGSTSEFSSEGIVNTTQHLMKTIVRPAVKIAGAASSCDPTPTPDPCLSSFPYNDPYPPSPPLSSSAAMIDVILPDNVPFYVNSISSSDESSKDDNGDDEDLENFVYDTFLTGTEPDFLMAL